MSGTSIILQFVTEADPVSAVIRYFSHSVVSHVDMVLDGGWLFGAHWQGGVKRRPPHYARWSRIIRVKLPTLNADDVEAAALTQDGKPYDMKAIFAFALDRDWRDSDSWICSELHAWALERGRYFERPLMLPASRITPGDLLFLTSTLGEVIADRSAHA